MSTGTRIRSIHAFQVYTNRGNPGVEAVVKTENGAVGILYRQICHGNIYGGIAQECGCFFPVSLQDGYVGSWIDAGIIVRQRFENKSGSYGVRCDNNLPALVLTDRHQFAVSAAVKIQNLFCIIEQNAPFRSQHCLPASSEEKQVSYGAFQF